MGRTLGSRSRYAGAIGILIMGLVPAASAQERGEVGIAVGETPDPVMIQDLEGADADLGQWMGKGPVVIEFWASWCENCEALQPSMDAAFEAYGDRVQFVAVAVAVAQSTRRVRRHLEDSPVPFPVLWDDGGKAVRAFLAPATSYVVALDAQGVVTYTGIGPDQDILAAAASALED